MWPKGMRKARSVNFLRSMVFSEYEHKNTEPYRIMPKLKYVLEYTKSDGQDFWPILFKWEPVSHSSHFLKSSSSYRH